ncbi:MAG: hypothetical protein ACREPM_14515 [Gemmatimonadaceae bacterium]
MDTTDPLIEFDERGWCNHCRNWERRAAEELPKGEQDARRRLDAIVERIKADGR